MALGNQSGLMVLTMKETGFRIFAMEMVSTTITFPLIKLKEKKVKMMEKKTKIQMLHLYQWEFKPISASGNKISSMVVGN
jgi:hypothetical protein